MFAPTVWNGKTWVRLSAEEWKKIISRILSTPPVAQMNKKALVKQLRIDKRDWAYLTSRNQDLGGEEELTISDLKRQILEYHSLPFLRDSGHMETLIEILENLQ